MESGKIVEYIDRQRIISSVVLENRNQRLRLLTETNREVNLSANRILFSPVQSLSISAGRDGAVDRLRELGEKRQGLSAAVDVEELWEVLHDEAEWIDLDTMTEFAFADGLDDDRRSAVIRAFFTNRTYFKFQNDRFFPYTPEQVEGIQAQETEAERRRILIESGGDWIKSVMDMKTPPDSIPEENVRIIEILKSLYLFEKECRDYALGKAILERAGIEPGDALFQLLVKLKLWDTDENIDLLRYETPILFPEPVMESARGLTRSPPDFSAEGVRRDLTHLDLITIDGQATLDYDDALSIEEKGGFFEVGIHIADVGHFVARDEPLDQEALVRASSIYMPDQKIPMLPPTLAEGLCSLRAGELRPAVSTLIRINSNADILGYEIVPSIIRVKHQLSYYDVNTIAEDNREISALHEIAKNFRKRRLEDGAVQICLPEINLWLSDDGEVMLNRTNRESPGRLLVSELMIMANWLMGTFIAEQGLPAVYRSQPPPRERLYKEAEGSLFQNWMQRKHLSRFVLSHSPEPHAGLGLNAYLTATSPIRKYVDLLTQRQIRAAYDLERPYTSEEVDRAIQVLEGPMIQVARIQNRRKRYWLLKHIEGKIGEREQAIVLNRRRNDYQILIPEYLVESTIPVSAGANLKPEDLIQITIQHVNARKDVLTVFTA